jgi:hypothetical protein
MNQHTAMAFYCGLIVEVLQVMPHCSLILHGHRELVVDTVDVVLIRHARAA